MSDSFGVIKSRMLDARVRNITSEQREALAARGRAALAAWRESKAAALAAVRNNNSNEPKES